MLKEWDSGKTFAKEEKREGPRARVASINTKDGTTGVDGHFTKICVICLPGSSNRSWGAHVSCNLLLIRLKWKGAFLKILMLLRWKEVNWLNLPVVPIWPRTFGNKIKRFSGMLVHLFDRACMLRKYDRALNGSKAAQSSTGSRSSLSFVESWSAGEMNNKESKSYWFRLYRNALMKKLMLFLYLVAV